MEVENKVALTKIDEKEIMEKIIGCLPKGHKFVSFDCYSSGKRLTHKQYDHRLVVVAKDLQGQPYKFNISRQLAGTFKKFRNKKA